jgi:hypothetical protein
MVLLAIGFLALNLAWMITDPFAYDANIGAGALILVGRFTGSLGLALVILDAVLRASRRRAGVRRPEATRQDGR